MKHVFFVGAKSLGAYGGYETFIDKLTEYHQNDSRFKYHVAVKANGAGAMDETKAQGVSNAVRMHDKIVEFTYHNARCFKIHVPNIGSAQAIIYDVKALSEICKYVEQKRINKFIVYIMACRIGPFIRKYYRKINDLGGTVYLNPDGHEWKREKWSKPIRKYWKESERLMIKYCDLIICDSINIEKYINESYKKYCPKTIYIAYGAETRPSGIDEEKYEEWLEEKGLRAGEYYLVVGRFVPENNYETMIREFMKSNSRRDFAIITTCDNKFLDQLEGRLHFKKDHRIKFVGTVYDQELLKKIRERAYGYFHGHEVGGTNPSLLEALGSTDINLLLQVGFNQEVGQNAAIYWSKAAGELAKLIDKTDQMSETERKAMGDKAKERITTAYSWEFICERYAEEFLK